MSFKNGKLYSVEKLTPSHYSWNGVQKAIRKNAKSSTQYIIDELYSIKWKRKPFPWSWTREFKPNRRFFFHGTTKLNIQNILDEGFNISYTRNGRMLGDGVYITYHTDKGKAYASDGYILSTMIYAPKILVIHPNQSLSSGQIPTLSKSYDAVEVRTNSIIGSWTMKNHEICVYDTRRVIPKFIIKLK